MGFEKIRRNFGFMLTKQKSDNVIIYVLKICTNNVEGKNRFQIGQSYKMQISAAYWYKAKSKSSE